jgi:hypothetical protein
MITAKVMLATVQRHAGQNGQAQLTFQADYNDGRNKEWSVYTPSLTINMSVKDAVADKFELGGAYTLTFTPSEEQS